MPKYAAFLRAVNLGPTRKISSADLRTAFEKLGFENVATFRTSGNVVFEARRKPVARSIEAELATGAGRRRARLPAHGGRDRRDGSPRTVPRKLVDGSKGKLQVMLLDKKPAAKAQKDVLAHATDEDRLAFGDRELYWLPSGGIRDSPLNMRALEKLLGSTTTRTKGTIEQLAAKYFDG